MWAADMRQESEVLPASNALSLAPIQPFHRLRSLSASEYFLMTFPMFIHL